LRRSSLRSGSQNCSSPSIRVAVGGDGNAGAIARREGERGGVRDVVKVLIVALDPRSRRSAMFASRAPVSVTLKFACVPALPSVGTTSLMVKAGAVSWC
jgi:hypothetical protein